MRHAVDQLDGVAGPVGALFFLTFNVTKKRGKIVIEERIESRRQIAARQLIADDPDLVERSLNELAFSFTVAVGVGACASLDQQERVIKDFFEGGGFSLMPLNGGPGMKELALYSSLLPLEFIDGQRVSEVGLGELLLLAFQAGDSCLL